MYQTVTLTGTYQLPDGSPAKGPVDIIPSEKVIIDSAGDVILSGRVKVQLDETGSFSVDLPATDDPALNPVGFGYTVSAKLNHQTIPAVSFSLPAALGTVDIADVTTVDPSTFVPDANYVTPAELEEAVAGVVVDTSGLASAADVDALEAEVGGRLSEASLSATIAAGIEDADLPGQIAASIARDYGSQPIHNLGPDPEFNVSSSGAWFVAGTGTGGAGTLSRAATGGYQSSPAAVLTFSADPTAGGGGIAYGRNADTGTGRIPVTPGQTYAVAVYGAASKSMSLLARIVWLNGTGPTFGVLSSSDGSTHAVAIGEQRRLTVTGTAPAGAAYMTVQVRSGDLSPLGIGDTLAASMPTIVTGTIAKQHVNGDEPGAFRLGAVDDSTIVGPPETIRVAHWGDSIAYGGTTVDSPGALLTSFLDAPFHNGGVSGESPAQIAARQTADEATRSWVQVLGLGHNGASGAFTGAQVVAEVQRCIDHLTGDRRFLVLELIPWANNDSTQRANYASVNAALAAAFPAHFVAVASWLRTTTAATAVGHTLTANDLTDISNGLTPRAYRTDDIHLNLLGRRAYAHRLKLEFAARGWAVTPGGVRLSVA